MKTVLASLLGLILATAAAAQVYRHVDEQGNVTFSDQPQTGSERIDIGPTNTAPPPATNIFPTPEPEAADGEAKFVYDLAITNPVDETIIPRGPGNFSVSASVSPALRDSHKLQLMMDGTPREEPQTATTWALTNVFRGEHNIQVAVIDDEGNQLGISEGIRVFVFRPSTNDRSRNRPPRPTPFNN